MSKLLWNDDYLNDIATKVDNNQSLQFWGFNEDGDVVFNKRHKSKFYSKFLPELGVFNLDMGLSVDSAETHTLVFVRGNRCQELKPSTLQTIVGRVLKNFGDLGQDLKAQMGMSNVFSLSYLDGSIAHLEDKTPFVDTPTSAYRFFQNGWIEITKDAVSPLRQYGEIPDEHIVWNSSIIARDYVEEETLDALNIKLDYLNNEKKCPITKQIVDKETIKSIRKELLSKVEQVKENGTLSRPTHYADFIQNLSRDNNGEVDSETLNRINLAIGFLCHRFNFPSNRKAVVVVDRFFSGAAKGSSNGRNGKGILIKSLRNLMDYCELSGKDFTKSRNDNMAFGKVRTHHELIHFDDAKAKTFDTERLFTQITGDFHIRGIGKDWVSIPAKNAPKIAISSNHPLKGTGSSFTERQFIVEVGHFYRLKLELEGLNPAQIHGGHIADADTDDWNDVDWTEFHRYVFSCIQLYLTYGGLPASHGSLDYKRAKLADDFDSEEVLDFLIECVDEYANSGEEVFVEVFYKMLREAFPRETKNVSNQVLWNWISEVGKLQEVVFNPQLSGSLDKQRLSPARLQRWTNAGMNGWTNKNGKVLGKDDKVQVFKAVRKETPNATSKEEFEIPIILTETDKEQVGIHTTDTK